MSWRRSGAKLGSSSSTDFERRGWISIACRRALPAIEVVFDPDLAEAAARRRPGESSARRIARTLLRPVKPLVEPVASKILAQLATRRQI